MPKLFALPVGTKRPGDIAVEAFIFHESRAGNPPGEGHLDRPWTNALFPLGSSRHAWFISLALVLHWQPSQVERLHVLEQLVHSLPILLARELCSAIVRREDPETLAVSDKERRMKGSAASG